MPTLITFQYKAKVPSSWQWQAGIQKSLPAGMVADVTYVGNHGYNRLGSFQGGTPSTPERGRHRRGVSAAEPGPDAGHGTVPGQTAYTTNLLRPFQGFAGIEQNTTEFYDTYHSIQFSLNRRFQRRVLVRSDLTRTGSPSRATRG